MKLGGLLFLRIPWRHTNHMATFTVGIKQIIMCTVLNTNLPINCYLIFSPILCVFMEKFHAVN